MERGRGGRDAGHHRGPRGGAAHGAGWQRQMLAKLEKQMPKADALAALLERYREHAESGAPVHEWPLD